jgi:hypothetical protein
MAMNRPSNNLRNFYFLFYFSRHKLEFSFKNAQAVNGPRTTDKRSKTFELGSRLTAFCKYHGQDTGEKLRKYIFYVVFLFRDKGGIKGNLGNTFCQN